MFLYTKIPFNPKFIHSQNNKSYNKNRGQLPVYVTHVSYGIQEWWGLNTSISIMSSYRYMQMKICPGLGYAFYNQDRPEIYNQVVVKQVLGFAKKFQHENQK